MRRGLAWLIGVMAAPMALAASAMATTPNPKLYDHLFWAAKWVRWERSCYHSEPIQWFNQKYGSRFEALKTRYSLMFTDLNFSDLPPELADRTVVWSCKIGRHRDLERKFVRILNEQEITFGLRER